MCLRLPAWRGFSLGLRRVRAHTCMHVMVRAPRLACIQTPHTTLLTFSSAMHPTEMRKALAAHRLSLRDAAAMQGSVRGPSSLLDRMVARLAEMEADVRRLDGTLPAR